MYLFIYLFIYCEKVKKIKQKIKSKAKNLCNYDTHRELDIKSTSAQLAFNK